LGIDPVPLKTCNFNCVYCQLGRTGRPVMRRRPFARLSRVLAELAEALESCRGNDPNWITLVGSGETTLCSGIGALIRLVKARTTLPVAVITNGSLLRSPRVRDELAAADAVLPSLDAGTEELFRRINRPLAAFSLADHIEGLARFRESYRGRLWVEVMLVDRMNDSPAALCDLADALRRIRPDEIHISTPTRPPAEPWVAQPSRQAVERAMSILGTVAPVLFPEAEGGEVEADGDLADAIAAVVARHPLSQLEVQRTLERWTRRRADRALERLRQRGDIQLVERFGTTFWCAAGMEFPAPGLETGRGMERRFRTAGGRPPGAGTSRRREDRSAQNARS
jgi:wyosine [tRNA(Phe)-imidazoG37] synthetase (radical SAM superfamily)